MRKEEEVTARKDQEDIEIVKLTLASTRQQLAQAMAVSAELDARLAIERQKTALLLDQLAERAK